MFHFPMKLYLIYRLLQRIKELSCIFKNMMKERFFFIMLLSKLPLSLQVLQVSICNILTYIVVLMSKLEIQIFSLLVKIRPCLIWFKLRGKMVTGTTILLVNSIPVGFRPYIRRVMQYPVFDNNAISVSN